MLAVNEVFLSLYETKFFQVCDFHQSLISLFALLGSQIQAIQKMLTSPSKNFPPGFNSYFLSFHNKYPAVFGGRVIDTFQFSFVFS
jgi:hypothetical protein